MVSSAPVRRIRPLLALLAGLLLAAHAAAESRVILISLDGATPAQLADPGLATLARMRREGAAAERMTPVFPTNTFPNHVSLVTGVAPDRHGIVNNVFLDPARGRYSYENDPSWIEVEPLWSLAARTGFLGGILGSGQCRQAGPSGARLQLLPAGSDGENLLRRHQCA